MTIRGLVLLAHGARDPSWAAPFEAAARRAHMKSPETLVRLAFLELMSPDLATVGYELAGLGCTRVDIVPLFLGAGGHVRRDVPAQVEALRAAHNGIAWTLHDAVGETARVIAALADAALDLAGLGRHFDPDPHDFTGT